MNKIWVIAYKDIRARFTDRTLLVIMLAAPLAISTIIGLAFGGLGRSTSPIQNIPLAVINNDQSATTGSTYGQALKGILTNGKLPSGQVVDLGGLIKGTDFTLGTAQGLINTNKIGIPAASAGSPAYLEAAARAAVDKGIYTAVVIIPADFSTALASLADPRQAPSSTNVIIYGNAGQGLSAGIVRSVVDTIISHLVGGNIAIGATISEIESQHPDLLAKLAGMDFSSDFMRAFTPGNELVQLSNQPVQAAPTRTVGALLVTIGSAQALFFALFTGQFGVLSMYEERKNGTLQRILVSPTPRSTIMGGKLVSVFVSVLFQLSILIIALTLVGSIIETRLVFIWGNDIGRLVLLLIAVAIASSGLGMFLAGVLKGVEQANIVGSVLNIALGVLGGAFGFQLPRSVAQFSFIYWARDAFDLLAAGRGDISLNLLVLVVEGGIMFLIGLFLFNRKFEV